MLKVTKLRLIQSLCPEHIEDALPMTWQRAFICAELVARRYGSASNDETVKAVARDIADLIYAVATAWEGV